jgi:hypothetical protein
MVQDFLYKILGKTFSALVFKDMLHRRKGINVREPESRVCILTLLAVTWGILGKSLNLSTLTVSKTGTTMSTPHGLCKKPSTM